MLVALSLGFSLAAPAWAEERWPIDNFNAGTRENWSEWCDGASKSPLFEICDEAAEGAHALRLTFPSTREVALIARRNLKVPAQANALSLWVKGDQGVPTLCLILEEDQKTPGGADCYRTAFPVMADGGWHKVILPLQEFGYMSSKFGSGKPGHQMDKAKLDSINFCVFDRSPKLFSVLVDNLEWVKTDPPEPAAGGGTRNVLPFDTSFETGYWPWACNQAPVSPSTTNRDAAFGKCALLLPPGGMTTGWQPGLFKSGQPSVLSFYARRIKGNGTLGVSVTTSGWATVVSHRFEIAADWKRYQCAIPAQSPALVASIGIGAEANTEILVDAMQLEDGTAASEYVPSEPVSVGASTGEPGEVVLNDRIPTLTVAVCNAAIPAERLPLSLSLGIAALPGPEILRLNETLPLAPGQRWEKKLPLPQAAPPGYYPVKLAVRDRQGKIVKECETPFVVTTPAKQGPIKDGYFGIHPHWINLQALQRIGVNWVRLSTPGWDYLEPEPGKFTPFTPEDYHQYGMGRLTWIGLAGVPGWAKGPNGLPAKAESVVPLLKHVMPDFNPVSDCYEFYNEPEMTLVGGPHNVTFQEAADFFAAQLKAAHPVIKASGNRLLVNMHGPFAEIVFSKAADSFDVYGPHTYTYPRYLGPYGGYIAGPEAGQVREQLLAAKNLIAKYHGKQEIWIGELGWGLDDTVPFDSEWAWRHAEFLARVHLLAMTVPEVKRIMWFLDIGQTEADRYAYGIWRDGGRPLPSVAAYATLTRMVGEATFKEFPANSDIKVAVFEKNGQAVVAVWNGMSKDNSDPLMVPCPAAGVRAVGMTGTPLAADPQSGLLRLAINGSPIYLSTDWHNKDRLVRQLLAGIKNSWPIQTDAAAADLNTLRLRFANNLDEPWQGEISLKLGAQSKTVPLLLRANESQEMKVPWPRPLPLAGGTLGMICRRPGKPEVRISRGLPPLLLCHRVKLDDWQTYDFTQRDDLIVLDKRSQVLPADPFVAWHGPENLSARIFTGWDKQYFYLMAEVTDDKFCQPNRDGLLWQGDGLQFGFDTLNDATTYGAYDQNDYEFGFAQTGAATQIWSWQAAAGQSSNGPKNHPRRIEKRPDGKLLYRVAIPWSELAPLTPVAGKVFGFNLVVNDNDGAGVNHFICMSPGLAPGKRPSLFPKMVLAK